MSNLSLFSPSEYTSRTKQEKLEFLMMELGAIAPVGVKKRRTVKIDHYTDYDYDLFSFNSPINIEALVKETFPEPKKAPWTDVQVGSVHEQLIVQLLEDIRDNRVADKTLIEWLFWVEGTEEDLGTPQPFSFEACCLYWDFDPDSFRHRITYLLRTRRGWDIRWVEREA